MHEVHSIIEIIYNAEAERNFASIFCKPHLSFFFFPPAKLSVDRRHKFTKVTHNLTDDSATIFVEKSHVVGGDLVLASYRDASPYGPDPF